VNNIVKRKCVPLINCHAVFYIVDVPVFPFRSLSIFYFAGWCFVLWKNISAVQISCQQRVANFVE